MRILKTILVVFVFFVFFTPKPASAGFESSLYVFFQTGTPEIIMLATKSSSFLEKNKELQKEIIVPLSVAIKNSLVRRGFVETETISHNLLNSSTVFAVEILVSKDEEIAVFLKENGKIKNQRLFKEITDFEKSAEDIIGRLLDNSKEF